MYTVLLADDEDAVLDMIQGSIPWRELGVEAVLTAPDGKKALEILESRRVDLLVTDVRMPYMDGIELVRTVRRVYPDIHCVLLTAYSEFAYAKEAINLGVENYLVKPVAGDELEQTIEKALDNIYRHRENSSRLLLTNTLHRWLSGTITSEELAERASFLGINLYLPCYCAVCVTKKESAASLALFYSACMDELSARYEAYHLWDEDGRCVFILGGKDIDRGELERVLEDLAREAGVTDAAAAAIGLTTQGADFLSLSYRSAREALALGGFASSGMILRSDSADSADSGGGAGGGAAGAASDLFAEELRLLFHQERGDARRAMIPALARKALAGGDPAAALTALMKTCAKIVLQEFPARRDIPGLLCGRWPRPGSGDSAEQAAERAIAAADALYREIAASLSPLAAHAAAYVRANLSGGISLKTICAKTGVNPAYLGHLFKKETGIFFNDYVTTLRISRSIISLAANPEIKIKDVAAQVGFFSTSYYEKCFRKQRGIPPLKYRMRLV